MMQESDYQKEFKEAFQRPTKDKRTGIVHVNNLYFASDRTHDIFYKSFTHLLDNEVDKETANAFARKILEVAYAPTYNTLFALNNHDGKPNECKTMEDRLFRNQPIWNQLWDRDYDKGRAHTNTASDVQYAVICWDNRHSPPVYVPPGVGGGYEIAHEIGHIHRAITNPKSYEKDTAAPAALYPLIRTKEEARNIRDVDDRILAAKGLPPRITQYDTDLSHLWYIGKRAPIFDSNLSGNIPRELVYVIAKMPVPEQDNFPTNPLMGIGAKAIDATIWGASVFLLAELGTSPSVKNVVKKIINLPAEMHQIYQDWRTTVKPADLRASAEEPEISGTSKEQDEGIIQVRDEQEWKANAGGLKFLQGGFFKRDQDNKNYILFTPNGADGSCLRLPIQMLPPHKTLTKEERDERYLDSSTKLHVAKLRVYKNKITDCKYTTQPNQGSGKQQNFSKQKDVEHQFQIGR